MRQARSTSLPHHAAHRRPRSLFRALPPLLLCAARASLAEVAPPATMPASQPASDGLPAVVRDGSIAAVDAVVVRGFRFTGNSAIGDRELDKVARAARAPYQSQGKALTLEQLERIRQALSTRYVERGYVNSGAILPDQTVADGIVQFDIVEGTLSKIEVRPLVTDGKRKRLRLREDYLERRLRAGTGDPLDVNELRDTLQLLRQDPNVRRVNATLEPGLSPGESVLGVSVEEAPLVEAGLSFNNHHTPSAGAERFEALFDVRSPLGIGDHLAANFDLTEGGFDEMAWSGLDQFAVHYALPITASGTTLAFDVQRSDELVIEQPFQLLDITSESNSFSLTLHHPLYRTPTRELGVFVSGAYRTSETSLLGERFSFEPGAINGEMDITVVRLGAEYVHARRSDSWAVRSTFSIGTDWFGATDNPSGIPDSQFFAWLGQANYVRRLGNEGALLSLRGAAQLAEDALPSLEKFAIGGYDTVRGYRENRLVRDSGVIGSVELRLPLAAAPMRDGRSIVELVPFVDAGYGRDRSFGLPGEKEFISSIGTGIVASPVRHLHMEVFYGYPFEKFAEDDDLQDLGIHFAIVYSREF